MIELFEQGARIGNEDGVVFYEQDIAKIKYDFIKDASVKVRIQYNNPGFGFLIEKTSNGPSRTGSDSFLVKLGADSFGAYRKQFRSQETLKFESCFFNTSIDEQEITFFKKGRELYIINDLGHELGKVEMPRDFDRFKLSIYSSQDNVIKSMEIENNVPDAWVTNVKNTAGGRLKFENNVIYFDDCLNNAEVEQHDIELEKGTYYLSYDIEGDLEVLAFRASEKDFDDDAKNILHDGVIYLEKDATIVFRIKGRSGKIGSISLRREKDGVFIPTGDVPAESEGSAIHIDFEEVLKATWKGMVHKIPNVHEGRSDYAFLETSIQRLRVEEARVIDGIWYDYLYNREDMTLTVSRDGSVVTQINISAAEEDAHVTLFRNMSVSIKEFVATSMLGVDTNLILQKTYKMFVPAINKKPILVYDDYKDPLDQSSAYFHYEENGETFYQFSNWDREYFYPNDGLILESYARGGSGDVYVYGVKGDVKWDNFLKITKNLQDIRHFAEHFDIIPEGVFTFDKEINCVDIDTSVTDKYSMIVVDYLKDDSYAINYNHIDKTYEVDISTQKERVFIQYENYRTDGVSSDSVIFTDIEPRNKNNYIVLREGN